MSSLGPSVASLRCSLSLLESSINLLDSGVSDFPRLHKVLCTQHHFEPLPEPTLRAAQQSVLDEVSPAIFTLLGTADAEIAQLEQRKDSLRARSELLEGRLGTDHQRQEGGSNGQQLVRVSSHGHVPCGFEETANAKALELKRLTQKRERLQYAVARLDLQSKQRERELRRSMAVVKE